jgi:sigma-B regulation protein RsbU (phosphoserine phosphatase)
VSDASENEIKTLKSKIAALEQELKDREADLRLFREELKGANTRLAHMSAQAASQLQALHHIQSLLVPTQLPNIPGFEFSSKFVASGLGGGDYFDIFEHEDRFRFGLLLSSSSGYGVSALLLSVFLKMAGRLEARRHMQASDFLQALLTEVRDKLQEQDRVSVFYGIVDRRHYEFNFSNSGGVTALYYNAQQKKLKSLIGDSPPLSRHERREFVTESRSLHPRDRIILCSQGVAESESESGEAFGRERIFSAILNSCHLPVHEQRNEIFFQLQQFLGSKSPLRDLSVVVTEVKDRVIKLAQTPG